MASATHLTVSTAEMIGLAAFFVAVHIYSAIVLIVIANKTKTSNSWLAWIPIANVYLMTQIGKLPAWYTLAILLPVVPYIGKWILVAALAHFWWKIAEVRNMSGWYGVLIIIPGVNMVVMWIIASKD